ncbi:hypothetical protein AAHE18_06G055500 [Arachis hypogaea]
MSMQRLEGKVAIVTGGASGIGAETVKLFAKHGACVVIADIQDDLGKQVATSIGTDKVSYRHCDVRDEKQVEETVAFTVEKYGGLDIMFSNAGVAGSQSNVLDMDLNDFDNTIAVNLRGYAVCIKHAARVMVARKTRGSIICTASTVATVSVGGFDATPLATRVLNMDASEVEEIAVAGANLKGIVLRPIHIAQAALFLASDESAYISGHDMVVDGGFVGVNKTFDFILKEEAAKN